MSNILIVGMQWGDEGKGKIIHEQAKIAKEENNKKTWIVRYQGGPNAGHTVYVRMPTGEIIEFISHSAPSGLTNNSDIAVGAHVAYDTEKFLNEVRDARRLFGYSAGIHISERVGILFDYHRKLDALEEATSNKKIGTTKSGIGPFYRDNANRRTRITFNDYVGDNFHDKLKDVLEIKKNELKDIINPDYIDELIALHDPIRKELKEYKCRLEYRLRDAFDNKENIIIEGAQGAMLDVDMGSIPLVTSSHLLSLHAFPSLGLPRNPFKIYGVQKAYPTRVGEGSMPTLADDEFGNKTQINSGEIGATTGRDRRVGYPDWVLAKYATLINDLDGIYLTRADCVQDKDIKVCTLYEFDNKQVPEVPLKLDKVKPIYDSKRYNWHLWDGLTDLSKPMEVDKLLRPIRKSYVDKGFNGLPKGLLDYKKDFEAYVGKPIVGISIGPAEDETVR